MLKIDGIATVLYLTCESLYMERRYLYWNGTHVTRANAREKIWSENHIVRL